MPRTLIEIERGSAEPLYRQVRRAIEHGIAVGRFDEAQRLPSSRELAAELQVSRNTINLAYQELIAEGFVESRERSGLFINAEMRCRSVAQRRETRPRIAWPERVRSFSDVRLPHIEKTPEWNRYPYPFVAGQIDVQAFPARAWLRSLRDALGREHVHASLGDSVGADDPLLVEMICRDLLPARGVEARPQEVLVTLGSQQGLDLLARALLGPEQVVAIEQPGYLDARHIFLRSGARVLPLEVDSSGLRPPSTLRGADLVYVTPSHQHPTNVTLSIGRRRELLELAAAAGTVVVEDDYDSEFRYHGRPTPALKALDSTGDTVYLGTFSKFLSPGLRLGYLVGPQALVDRLRDIRRYVLRHPPGHLQRALALLIERGEYQRAVRRYRTVLLRKWQTACAAAQTHLPWRQRGYPPGGTSLWMTGPPTLDCRVLVEAAQQRGILIERGDIFYSGDEPPRNHFRVGFAATPQVAVCPGLALLGNLCADLGFKE